MSVTTSCTCSAWKRTAGNHAPSCPAARPVGGDGRECTCCPPGKRPAVEHARGCPRRAPRTVPLSTASAADQLGLGGDTREALREEIERWLCDRVQVPEHRAITASYAYLALPAVRAALDAQETEPDDLARRFHETYERLAPEFGYKTREASAVPWEQVPEANRRLMVAVCAEILAGDR